LRGEGQVAVAVAFLGSAAWVVVVVVGAAALTEALSTAMVGAALAAFWSPSTDSMIATAPLTSAVMARLGNGPLDVCIRVLSGSGVGRSRVEIDGKGRSISCRDPPASRSIPAGIDGPGNGFPAGTHTPNDQ
jgi:hypothetical protein